MGHAAELHVASLTLASGRPTLSREHRETSVKVLSIVGARPNFVKMAPIARQLALFDIPHVVVHTGQHYDQDMSSVFFDDLDVPAPDHMLGVGSATHAVQTARIMERLEPILLQEQPDVVLVPGDVNSTLGAALVAAKLGLRVGHVEAGLRSFDRSMPEEINRIVADALSDFLFVHSASAVTNLAREGVAGEKTFFVGNTMIDTLVQTEPRFRSASTALRLGLRPSEYILVTLHRPALVDGPLLADAMTALASVSKDIPVVFPLHPRTRQQLNSGHWSGVSLIDPLGYIEFLSLEADAAAVLTDSGGVQEETTYLGVPCFTLRDNTERPVTVSHGTNTLLGLDPGRIEDIPSLLRVQCQGDRSPRTPELWDGHAAERLVQVLMAGV